MTYTYKKTRAFSLLNNSSRILGLDFTYGKDRAKIRGQLQTLFGNPVYTGPNAENAYSYLVIMEDEHGNRYVLEVYSAKSGPSIGGNTHVKGIEDAAQELKQYIAKASPSDYEYTGAYPRGKTIIMGVKNGEPYYSETDPAYEATSSEE